MQETYGDIDALTVRDLPAPVPAADEVVVRVRAASMHPDVWHVVAGRPAVLRLMGSGLRRPSDPVPGTDVAGVVDSVGSGVTRLRVGDEVFGETVRGMQWRNGGAYAELVAVAEGNLVAQARHPQLRAGRLPADRRADRAGQPRRRTRCTPATGCWSTAPVVAWARSPSR